MPRAYGLIRDAADDRDHRFMLGRPGVMRLAMPDNIDVESWMPPVLDQGNFGTCVAHGTTAAMRYDLINTTGEDVALSRVQPYYDAGMLEGDTSDSGRQIRDMVKVAASLGVCEERFAPYDYTGISLDTPSDAAYASAARHRVSEYQRADCTARALQTALFVGRPVIIGVELFKQFDSDEAAATGMIRMPRPHETSTGLHCMVVIGRTPAVDKVRNSWGPDWGAHGNCFLPRGYVEAHGQDFWVIYTNS